VRVACVGGGPAGLYFALLLKLRDPGHDITVFERSATVPADGFGVVFDSGLLETLYAADAESARQIDKAAFRWVGQAIDVDGSRALHGGSGYSISRQRLLEILAERAHGLGVRIEFGREVVVPSQLPDADLVVACDGVNSRARNESGRFGTSIHVGSNKYLWLATGRVFESFTFPFVHTDGGWIWAHAYGYDAKSSTFIVECSPETWEALGFGAMQARDSIPVLEKIFANHLRGHGLASRASDRWLNFRTVVNQCWYDGRTVLAGDAAHTTHFTIGSGTKLAIEDAVALARSLQEHAAIEPALGSYEKRRQFDLFRAQSDARFSALWFENITRYVNLGPEQFLTLLIARRSPLLPRVPPQVYYRLYRATDGLAALREFRRGVKAIYVRRGRAALSAIR